MRLRTIRRARRAYNIYRDANGTPAARFRYIAFNDWPYLWRESFEVLVQEKKKKRTLQKSYTFERSRGLIPLDPYILFSSLFLSLSLTFPAYRADLIIVNGAGAPLRSSKLRVSSSSTSSFSHILLPFSLLFNFIMKLERADLPLFVFRPSSPPVSQARLALCFCAGRSLFVCTEHWHAVVIAVAHRILLARQEKGRRGKTVGRRGTCRRERAGGEREREEETVVWGQTGERRVQDSKGECRDPGVCEYTKG